MNGLTAAVSAVGTLARRSFLGQLAALAVGGLSARGLARAATATEREGAVAEPVFVSTWAFGKVSNEVAMATLDGGGSLLDAVEQGVRATEADLTNHSVGAGGTPNADGVVQLDACIMDGPGQRAGSVAGIEGIAHPISVARRVMERTPHVMLVGAGARQFALQQGFESVDLLTENRRLAWRKWLEERAPLPTLEDSHDTIALLGRAADGAVAGGCSTSGWGYKVPGRVGDSPILGGGLYVDGDVGAAGATGTGENVMRYCGSYRVVDLMARGADPQSACVETVRHILRKDPKGPREIDIHFVAVDRQGRHGAAGTGTRFEYAVTGPSGSQVLKAEVVD